MMVVCHVSRDAEKVEDLCYRSPIHQLSFLQVILWDPEKLSNLLKVTQQFMK